MGNLTVFFYLFCYLFSFCFVLFETSSLYVSLVGLEFREISLILPGMLELKACTTTPFSKFIFGDKILCPCYEDF